MKMEVIYTHDMPAHVPVISWKALAYLDPRVKEEANEWLVNRFGRMPLIYEISGTLITHWANKPVVERAERMAGWPSPKLKY